MTVLQFPSSQSTESRKVSLEDGYTRVADELIEELSKTDLSGREFRILLCIIRKTYGFCKPDDWIALSQFAEMTGINKPNSSALLKRLCERKIIIRSENGNDRRYSINTTVSEWTGKPKKQGVIENDNRVIEINNKSRENDNKPLKNDNHNKQYTNKQQLKDIVRDDPSSPTNSVKKPARKRNRFTDEDMRFAVFMFSQISIVANDRKKPNFEVWANTIRLMREQDGKTAAQIGTLFRWANTHPANNSGFSWSTVVLSPDSLRRHWKKIAAQYHQEKLNEIRKPVSSISDEFSKDWMPDD